MTFWPDGCRYWCPQHFLELVRTDKNVVGLCLVYVLSGVMHNIIFFTIFTEVGHMYKDFFVLLILSYTYRSPNCVKRLFFYFFYLKGKGMGGKADGGSLSES